MSCSVREAFIHVSAMNKARFQRRFPICRKGETSKRKDIITVNEESSGVIAKCLPEDSFHDCKRILFKANPKHSTP